MENDTEARNQAIEFAMKATDDEVVVARIADAAPGTIRADFATSIGENTAHGSDAPDTAAFETGWFFAGIETNTVERL